VSQKVEFTFDPIGITGADPAEFTEDQVDAIRDQVSDFVLTQVLSDASAQVSSVDGSKWEPLTKNYAMRKKAQGGKPIANLELTGDYLSSFKMVKRASGALTLTVDADQMGKADGHNDHSGESPLPRRRSIPSADDGDVFSERIMAGIADIVDSARDSSPKELEKDTEDLSNDRKAAIEDLGFRTAKAQEDGSDGEE
jgi:hypothetical protein